MKTFVTSLMIFAIVCAAVFSLSALFSARLTELYNLASDLPENKTELAKNHESALRQIEELRALWYKTMRIFPYFMGYDILDRADDAAQTLFSCAGTGETSEFFSARLRFCDALKRLDELCSVSLEGIM